MKSKNISAEYRSQLDAKFGDNWEAGHANARRYYGLIHGVAL